MLPFTSPSKPALQNVKEHFDVGEYVTINENDRKGVIYEIIGVKNKSERAYTARYVIIPVFGLFDAAERRGVRVEQYDALNVVDLVTIAHEYNRLGNFIRDISRKLSGE